MSPELRESLIIVSPILVLLAGALGILIAEVWIKGEWPRGRMTLLTLLLALVATLFTFPHYDGGKRIFDGIVYADPFACFTYILLLTGTYLSMLIGIETLKEEGIESRGEFYALILMATIGAVVFVSSAELITMFVGLEIMSMALYCLCGSALHIKSSAESALKYFLLGSFSSAFMLYGIALLYGLTQTTFIPEIAQQTAIMSNPMLYLSLGLMLTGFLFKIGAVPFHFWAPDVYQGAPTTVTAYMACVIKASAVLATLRVIWGIFEAQGPLWVDAIWVVAVCTMTLGNLLALKQPSMKRMLAYSSVAHAGYMLVGLLSPYGDFGGGAAIMYYLVAYTMMTIGAFGVVLAVSVARSSQPLSDHISRFNGLARSHPALAAFMALFMLALAGIPPGLSGLVGKFYIFNAAVKADYVGIAIIGVINSAISAYYYLRVIVAMYFIEGDHQADTTQVRSNPSLLAALTICSILIVVLGIFPSVIHRTGASVVSISERLVVWNR